MSRQIILLTLGNINNTVPSITLTELPVALVADARRPEVCESCPAGAPPHSVWVQDENGICTCLPHSFSLGVTVQPREAS